MMPNDERMQTFRENDKHSHKNHEEDLIEKKLAEYYKNQSNEVPHSFENAIQTAFSDKRNKNFLQMLARKNKSAKDLKDAIRNFRRMALRTTQVAILVVCLLCTTHFVNATSFWEYLSDVLNLNTINVNNGGIEQALENGDLQNLYTDYKMQNGIGVKASYVLMNELNLYLVFDIETDFDLYEAGIENVSFKDLRITNDSGEELWDEGNFENIKGNKIIIQDKNHLKNVVFMVSDSFASSNNLNIKFNDVVFYSNEDENRIESSLYKKDVEFEYEYSIRLDKYIDNKRVEYSVEKNTSPSIQVEKVILDDTGLNLLVLANDTDFELETNAFTDLEYNSSFIKVTDTYKRELVINIPGIKEKDNIKIRIKIANKKYVLDLKKMAD